MIDLLSKFEKWVVFHPYLAGTVAYLSPLVILVLIIFIRLIIGYGYLPRDIVFGLIWLSALLIVAVGMTYQHLTNKLSAQPLDDGDLGESGADYILRIAREQTKKAGVVSDELRTYATVRFALYVVGGLLFWVVLFAIPFVSTQY